MRRPHIGTGIWLLMLFASATAFGSGLHIIELRHQPASEILPVIRPLLAPGGSASGQGFNLFVRTSPHNFSDIRRAVARLDVAEPMLHISVRESRRGGGLRRLRATGDVAQSGIKHLALAGGETPPRPHSGSAAGRYRIELRTSRNLGYTTRSIFVLDGHRAFIQVGRSYPQIQPFVALANGQIDIGGGIEYRDVTTGFEVLPQLHGNRVWIKITPQFSFTGNHGGQTVDFRRLRTTIDARLGQWVDLGGTVGTGSQVTRQILGRTAVTGGIHRRILIRVDR